MKYILNIEFNKLNIKATFIKINKNYINIENEVISVNKKELSYKNVNELKKIINESHKKYQYINYNIQTEDILIRNIKNINIKNKKETISQIKYEVIKHIPININEYEIKYKILNKENNIASIQVILFPKYLINLCKNMSKILGIRAKTINVNFDNIQKLIEQKLIKNLQENAIILELRKDEILLNKVIKNKILESYVVPKNLSITNHINSLDEYIKDVYTYGDEALNTENLSEFNNLNISKIILNTTNKKVIISSELNQDTNKYINTIGMVI